MKRFLCFILAFCFLGGTGSVMAVDFDLPVDGISEKITQFFEDLALEEKLDDLEMETLISDAKALVERSAALTVEQLHDAIVAFAAQHGITLNDEQVSSFAKLCRSLEKGVDLKEKADGAKVQAANLWQRFREIAHKAAGFFLKLGTWLQRI